MAVYFEPAPDKEGWQHDAGLVPRWTGLFVWSAIMYYPTLAQVKARAREGNLIPVYRSIHADLETPSLGLPEGGPRPLLLPPRERRGR